MMPLFSVRPDGRPDVSWDDPYDPRSLLAHFIGSEIYLFLDNAEVFLQAVATVERGEKDAWRWSGNSFSVDLNKEGCTITHHWTEPGDPFPGVAKLTLQEFGAVIASWRDFVTRQQERQSAVADRA